MGLFLGGFLFLIVSIIEIISIKFNVLISKNLLSEAHAYIGIILGISLITISYYYFHSHKKIRPLIKYSLYLVKFGFGLSFVITGLILIGIIIYSLNDVTNIIDLTLLFLIGIALILVGIIILRQINYPKLVETIDPRK